MGAARFTLTAEQRQRVERLAAEGKTEEEIASEFDVTSRTFRRAKTRDKLLREALARGRAARTLPEFVPPVDRIEFEQPDYAACFRAAGEGVSDRTIARRLGVSYAYFQDALENDPTLAEMIRDGRAENADKWVSYLENAAQSGTALACIAGLEMLHGYQRAPKPEDADRVQIIFHLPGSATPEQWEKIIDVKREQKQIPETVEGGENG